MPKHRNKGETVYFDKIKVKRGSTVELPKKRDDSWKRVRQQQRRNKQQQQERSML